MGCIGIFCRVLGRLFWWGCFGLVGGRGGILNFWIGICENFWGGIGGIFGIGFGNGIFGGKIWWGLLVVGGRYGGGRISFGWGVFVGYCGILDGEIGVMFGGGGIFVGKVNFWLGWRGGVYCCLWCWMVGCEGRGGNDELLGVGWGGREVGKEEIGVGEMGEYGINVVFGGGGGELKGRVLLGGVDEIDGVWSVGWGFVLIMDWGRKGDENGVEWIGGGFGWFVYGFMFNVFL